MVMSGSFKTNGDAGFSAGAKTEQRQKTAMTDDQMRVRFISSFQTGRSIIAGLQNHGRVRTHSSNDLDGLRLRLGLAYKQLKGRTTRKDFKGVTARAVLRDSIPLYPKGSALSAQIASICAPCCRGSVVARGDSNSRPMNCLAYSNTKRGVTR
jgi:hypothetical protein